MWCWDITWLPGPIRGQFTCLYLIIDVYSRKIVGWEVHEVENSAQARALVERTVWREGILDPPRVLHGDNGSPLKGATVQSLLGRLGITASFSRPRVSDDNARSLSRAQSQGRGPVSHLEVLPELSTPSFATLAAAQRRACPARSRRVAILRGRHELYEAARR